MVLVVPSVNLLLNEKNDLMIQEELDCLLQFIISLTFQTGSAVKISITASPLSSLWNFRIAM